MIKDYKTITLKGITLTIRTNGRNKDTRADKTRYDVSMTERVEVNNGFKIVEIDRLLGTAGYTGNQFEAMIKRVKRIIRRYKDVDCGNNMYFLSGMLF